MSKKLRFVAFLSILVFVAACSTKVVKFDGDKEQLKVWKKTALAELVITPPNLPLFPLIDAGMYRAAFYEITPQIITLHKEKIGELTDALGARLKEHSGADVVFGMALLDSEDYKAIKSRGVSVYPVKLDNEKFPEVIIREGSENFIDYSAGGNSVFSNFSSHLKEEPLKANVAALCKALNVDGVVMAAASVDTINAGAFGIMGARLLRLRLFYFDKSGNIILEGYASSEATSHRPAHFENYAATLSEFNSYADQLVRLIYDKVLPEPKKEVRQEAAQTQ